MPSIPMPPERQDDTDAAKDREAQRIMTGPLKPCPMCGCHASSQDIHGKLFPARIFCSSLGVCGIQTPWVRTLAIAEIIWNRRAPRKTKKLPARNNALIDKSASARHTADQHRRSSAGAKGAGKRATARKGAHTKESDK